MHKTDKKRLYGTSKLKKYLLTILSSIAFEISFISVRASIINIAATYNISDTYISIIEKVIYNRFIIITFFIIMLIGLYFLYSKEIDKKQKYPTILSVIFTCFLITGNSYRSYGTVYSLFRPKLLVLNLILITGFYFFLLYSITAIINSSNKFMHKTNEYTNKIFDLFDRHPFIFSFWVMALFWSIYHIAFYPMILSPDPSNQLIQALGERTKYSDYAILLDENVNITNHHPVLHTLLLGSYLRLGRAIYNDNFGLYIYTFVQSIFMICTLSYTIVFLKKLKIKCRYLIILLGIYSFVPMFPLYSLNANKDVYFSLLIMWLFIMLFSFVHNKTETKMSFVKCTAWVSVLLLICLFRNNGIYIVILLFPCLLIFSKVNIKKFITIFMLVIALFYSYKNILLPHFHITDVSIRETMSIFFQQTARYVSYHEDELTDEDKNAIANLLDYEAVKTKYNPILSDPIKNTYNKYATSTDLKKYFKFWLKGLTKHPLTYIDATLNNIYGYFDPEDINWYIYVRYDPLVTENNLIDYHFNSCIDLRNILSIYGAAFIYIPVLGLISNVGLCNWIIIALGIYLIMNKKYKYLIPISLLYIIVLCCIASPANTYFRYAMPYVYLAPTIIGTWGVIKDIPDN